MINYIVLDESVIMNKLSREQYMNKLRKESQIRGKTEWVYTVFNLQGDYIGRVKASNDHDAIIKAMKKYDVSKNIIVEILEDDEINVMNLLKI